MTRRWIVGALLAVALIPAVACSSDDDKDSSSAATSAAGTSAAAATTAATTGAGVGATRDATTAPAAAATSAATAPAAGAATSGPQTMEVKAGEWFYEPGNLSLRTGAITLTLNNGGERPHTLYVRKPGGPELAKTERIEPGQTGTLQFTLSEPGTYEIFCNLPGHADRGQKGTLTVTAV